MDEQNSGPWAYILAKKETFVVEQKLGDKDGLSKITLNLLNSKLIYNCIRTAFLNCIMGTVRPSSNWLSNSSTTVRYARTSDG